MRYLATETTPLATLINYCTSLCGPVANIRHMEHA